MRKGSELYNSHSMWWALHQGAKQRKAVTGYSRERRLCAYFVAVARREPSLSVQLARSCSAPSILARAIVAGFLIQDPMQRERGKTAARGYGGRWQRERLTFLAQHPLCVMCQADGRITLAKVVDHIIPHKGDPVLMWDSEHNWQSLCAEHHSSDKQRLEKSGKTRQTIGLDGWPI